MAINQYLVSDLLCLKRGNIVDIASNSVAEELYDNETNSLAGLRNHYFSILEENEELTNQLLRLSQTQILQEQELNELKTIPPSLLNYKKARFFG